VTRKSSKPARSTAGKGGAQPLTLPGLITALIVGAAALIINQCSGGTGTVVTPPTLTPAPIGQVTPGDDALTYIELPMGTGAAQGFWQVLFTIPSRSRNPADYVGGIDVPVAALIDGVERTLDIAAFEFNNAVLTDAVLRAKSRGVQVRMVVDGEHGLEDEASTVGQFIAAGIPVVGDTRTAFMHDKFMILDGLTVITGSWNFTVNDTYRNNNNALVLRSRNAALNYQAEFDEMFTGGQFGPRSPRNTPFAAFTQDGVPMAFYMGPEDRPMDALAETVSSARESIRFMAFSFTHDALQAAMLTEAENGIDVQGIFERTGSQTAAAAMIPMLCAGVQVRQDANPFVLHHKVVIVDEEIVITGSFNFSDNATQSNDENLVIIGDRALAAQYLAEYDRRWAEASTPADITCP
jgi:phosphatidylserine/phosphatidylglycerophosphate/cardiolipin synthase-like enzyme